MVTKYIIYQHYSLIAICIVKLELREGTCQNMKEACLSSICSDQLNAEDLDLEKGGTTLLFIFLWRITCHEFRNL